METQKRMPICWRLTDKQREWLDNNCCPICGLHRDNWSRRKDWRCCSKACTTKFSEEVVLIWQYFKEDVFKRDNYTCIKCGKKPLTKNHWKELVPDTSQLIGDHIIPIAIGGEEYDLDNVQTLCIECNRIKTKKDMKTISLYRKKHPSQKILEGKT